MAPFRSNILFIMSVVANIVLLSSILMYFTNHETLNIYNEIEYKSHNNNWLILNQLKQQNTKLQKQIEVQQLNIQSLYTHYNINRNSSNWYSDLIPAEIQYEFPIKSNFHLGEFDITETMLRQTRPIIGNTLRLHKILQSIIYQKQCMKILSLGASVTAGTNVGGYTYSYSPLFEQWLNTKYPCQSEQEHQVIPYTTGGSTIIQIVENFESLLTFINDNNGIDIILIEYNVNDNFLHNGWSQHVSNNSNIDANKKDIGSKEQTINWYSELFIRRLLLLNNNTALIFFDASFMDFYKAIPYGHPDGDQTQFLRYAILSYYAIPTISAVVPLFNLFQLVGDEGRDNQNQSYWSSQNMYGWWNIMTDKCCHPFRFGHRFMAITLAYNFHKEIKWLKFHESNLSDFEYKRNWFIPPLWRVSQEEFKFFAAKLLTHHDIGKEKPIENVDYFNNDGFRWYSDTIKEKFGLIATKCFAHISFKISTDIGLVSIGYLATYTNISSAVIWVDDQQMIDVEYLPNKYVFNHTFEWWYYWKMTKSIDKILTRDLVVAKISDHVSVYNAQKWMVSIHGDHMLHIVVVPNSRNTGVKNAQIDDICKFKLLSIGSS